WQGAHPDPNDVDECMTNPCSNGGQCKNTYGSYKCSCSRGFGGRLCELKVEVQHELVSSSWENILQEVFGAAVFVVSMIMLVLIFILIHKKLSNPSKQKSSCTKEKALCINKGGVWASHMHLRPRKAFLKE
uniref:EGF-like domain-containing protein n=1 Tax=Scleropages formosus TaxID=113540 RepID=A0A8C9TKS1_SCLFO